MVYHPIQRFNEWRLNPPAWLRARRPRSWTHLGMSEVGTLPAGEKIAGDVRTSQDTKASEQSQRSRWSAESGNKLLKWSTSKV